MCEALESTRGRRALLEDFRGRAVVLFYASRGHTSVNDDLKHLCGRLSLEHGDRLAVLGVANLHGLRVARRLVSGAVKAIAAGYGTELWMDFDGVLQRGPHALASEGAELLVLGPDGRVMFRASGELDAPARGAFEDALGALLARAPRRAA